MRFTTTVRDCLYLNWALPVRLLPAPPEPLRLDRHLWRGEEWSFVSALLFRHSGLQSPVLPLLRLSHPQCNVRVNTLAPGEGPSVLFREMLAPAWVAPAVRLVAQQPLRTGSFRYPAAVDPQTQGEWQWTARRGSRRLTVRARLEAPGCGEGPEVGSWEETVAYFRLRPLGYARHGRQLRRIRAVHPRVTAWPMRVEVVELDLLLRLFPQASEAGWPPLHSAWLCPEIPFDFALSDSRAAAVAPQAAPTG